MPNGVCAGGRFSRLDGRLSFLVLSIWRGGRPCTLSSFLFWHDVRSSAPSALSQQQLATANPPVHKLLQIFAYGTLSDYKGNCERIDPFPVPLGCLASMTTAGLARDRDSHERSSVCLDVVLHCPSLPEYLCPYSAYIPACLTLVLPAHSLRTQPECFILSLPAHALRRYPRISESSPSVAAILLILGLSCASLRTRPQRKEICLP